MQTSQNLETVSYYGGNPGLGGPCSPFIQIPYIALVADNQNTDTTRVTIICISKLEAAALLGMTDHEKLLYFLYTQGGIRDHGYLARIMSRIFGANFQASDVRIALRNVRVLTYWRYNAWLQETRDADDELREIGRGGAENVSVTLQNLIIQEYNAISDLDNPQVPRASGDSTADSNEEHSYVHVVSDHLAAS